jgi:hypothetical protein
MANMHGISHPKNQTRNPDEKNQNWSPNPKQAENPFGNFKLYVLRLTATRALKQK